MFLLSLKAGLRAHEIASITWGMVTDAEGEISNTIEPGNQAAKGKSGRRIPMPDLRTALIALHQSCAERVRHDRPVIFSERDPICRRSGGVVSPALCRSRHGRLLITFGAPHIYHSCGSEDKRGGG